MYYIVAMLTERIEILDKMDQRVATVARHEDTTEVTSGEE